VHVTSFKKPTERSLEHDFLWRVPRGAPADGEICAINSSHYDDGSWSASTTRQPEGLEKRYKQITEFERTPRQRTVDSQVLSAYQQRRTAANRLQQRSRDPKKHWKFQHGDSMRRKLLGNDYMDAYADMLEHNRQSITRLVGRAGEREVVSQPMVASVSRMRSRSEDGDPTIDLSRGLE